MKLHTLETPCLVLDRKKLLKNISRLNKRLAQHRVRLRPHAKTAKNIDIIRLATSGDRAGITVSTLKEAEYFFEHGITDMTYAVGIAPVKLDRLARLLQRGAQVSIILDSMEQAQMVAAYASEHGLEIPVLIEIDCDGHRSGVPPADPLLSELGRYIHTREGTILAGVLTHAGESYGCGTADCIRQLAKTERDAAVSAAKVLRSKGLPCPVVSIGSTPTAFFGEDFSGITEVRAGVYVFFDLVMAGLGVCTIDDIAVSVLTSVIGHQKQKQWTITDAGWMALSRDRGTATQAVDRGYGVVCDIRGLPLPGLMLSATNQEHGIITVKNDAGGAVPHLQIGDMLRILPNHACATAAMHDRYYVTDDSAEISDIWSRINYW